MNNLYEGENINIDKLFDNYFLEVNTLYWFCFKQLPSVDCINSVNGEKLYDAFCEKFKDLIRSTHKYRWYKPKRKAFEFDKTVVILANNCIIEFEESYCEILHNGTQSEFVMQVAALSHQFKEREKREPLEINLIVTGNSGLSLQSMEIKRTKLNIDLFYEDDFKQVDELIRTRLNKKNDKGIVLLHGLPGTGKTTYLRYLICKLKKRVLFLSPNVAGNLMNPEFIDLLIKNPNTVVVIEDAENIIMDRRSNSSSAVSNLLNISDGLLADFLNVQLICTFNSALTLVDSALLRKGRLIARYEFGKLSTAKAQQLSNHLGFNKVIDQPMTLAEISNQNEVEFDNKQVQVIGFRNHTSQQSA
ncbi:ATPase family associated with various cellular activities (AAA) [Filimonas lacunae]|uniref:ATPase family associated with various cellular activities (AAA) n=1 Tax=Filimonas lacunae TaxID=477680 RepID=A0A173MPF0_9BACT|nr:AAA family ATPase [Filimonas lacunae]BAV09339.1 hypothetical protein FLA_5387 [Filimonas lacunae]SIS71372.1 ATPase family associated with various cellular activities (AAA) [Filimonas lacunae]